jgi:hypothetical protein
MVGACPRAPRASTLGKGIAIVSFPRSRTIGVWTASLLGLSAIAVGYVKHQDQDNRFCVSCHLHEAHYRDTIAMPASTLSAAHFRAPADSARAGDDPPHRATAHPERCFTCHSGEGVMGWTQVTVLSAWDAARWVLGDRHEPVAMRLPIANAACLKCHPKALRGTMTAEETSSYHELTQHRAVTTPCVACHVVHARGATAQRYLDPVIVRARCQTCHRDLEGAGA